MKFGVLALTLSVALVASTNATVEDGTDQDNNIAYDYVRNVSLPLAKRNNKTEKQAVTVEKTLTFEDPSTRIIDGTPAKLGEVPYQAGLLGHYNGGVKTCGGSLLTVNRVVTAAHCWWNGKTQVTKFTVVLGSITLSSGGVRMQTSKVIMHEKWNPRTVHDDIAMVYLPQNVKFSKTIQPIPLPSGSMLHNDFVGYMAFASGYGDTRDGNPRESLYYAALKVITNKQCSLTHGDVPPTEICTSSNDFKNICNGDSGGPLAVFMDNRPVLIGITSYGVEDCKTGKPSGYTRVTAYIDWIKKHL